MQTHTHIIEFKLGHSKTIYSVKLNIKRQSPQKMQQPWKVHFLLIFCSYHFSYQHHRVYISRVSKFHFNINYFHQKFNLCFIDTDLGRYLFGEVSSLLFRNTFKWINLRNNEYVKMSYHFAFIHSFTYLLWANVMGSMLACQ